MEKYHGAIIDDFGYIVFEFITRYCRGEAQASQQAGLILDAWKSTHPNEKYFYTLTKG